ncbi:MAG: metallophosphatase family protein [Cyanobacteria bacterium]|nr:metallophosphatase family protein [Cyanobacteriota bacterium]
MIVAVISDTHVPNRAKDLPEEAYELIDSSDMLIHAGDMLTKDFLARLEKRLPVSAVRGNNDVDLQLPETLELTLDDVNVAVIHDSGPSKGRRERMQSRFPNARIVIYGHSHIPECSDEGGLLLLNPGSPTDRRRQPYFTMALLELKEGEISAEIITLR